MANKRLIIEDFLTLQNQQLLLDVRSPAEYTHAHIPGAINLPLFSDDERKIIGTAYKQQSREIAIKLGLDFFGPKMRPMVETVESILQARQNGVQNSGSVKNMFIYCWRGGMRSGAVAWLLNLYGFQVHVLAGGYKSFRRWTIERNNHDYQLQVLGGFTGSGKTQLLNELESHGETVLNLEAIASHKGSAFGNIGMPVQPSQEMFENMLAFEIWRLQKEIANSNGGIKSAIWVEDESQRIGHVNIPAGFWKNMRNSPLYFLKIPFDERLQHIVHEYGSLDRERMKHAIERITKRLGGLEAKNAISFLEEGKVADCFRILLQYYDKQYAKALHNRENLAALKKDIECVSVSKENAMLLLKALHKTYAGTT